MKKIFGSALMVCLVVFVMITFGCGNGSTGGGGGWGGGGGYTVTVNNLHPSYNGERVANTFLLLDTTSGDATASANDVMATNGSITGTFYKDRTENWEAIQVALWGCRSTETFPLSQRNIVIDAKNIGGRGRTLADPNPGVYY